MVNSVPQWFETEPKGYYESIAIGNREFFFSSHRRLTPQLYEVLDFCKERQENWLDNLPPILSSSARKQISQDIALFWLSKSSGVVNWYKFIAYAEEMLVRTYENIPVSTHLLISPDEIGRHDITDLSAQKLLDPLSTSLQTYLKVDAEANLISYEQINWEQIKDTEDYKFNPEFLQPFASTIKSGQFSFHVTTRGDVLILDDLGLLAACRKGTWHIYDVKTLKNSIGDISGNYRIGCNIFETLLDLSYKRHGALLIYDPDHKVIQHVVNIESIIFGNQRKDLVREMLASSVIDIAMSSESMLKRKKRVMLELAGMDGAVIFDSTHIIAFGAMIDTHPKAGNHSGARTTAFESAFLYGGKPFKVSSDGDISLRFNKGCGKLSFL